MVGIFMRNNTTEAREVQRSERPVKRDSGGDGCQHLTE